MQWPVLGNNILTLLLRHGNFPQTEAEGRETILKRLRLLL
jgi:hypothetical protein